ncbi:MAG: aminotransferase class V-fold PLP-dependent enzyme [SAR202 cluster bacterium]|jgi:L-seryl-tRNA(Ser) seleniumtransferase|nr:L-seryl-tRNA selenium transferase [Chloroflexota bacterium]MDP6422482.1 aminotransferase class V-fold PLP-dependent enzyme [SAR202 cluster bacterium]HAL47963.1 L-seryl-tRNA selenium transferase [Dehalococcoidia bacterium]MDP6663836.1 aminotransferase class V-fold PLP-dependent enzyme [SAR202 cluster bacterium]MDP6801229.1 aminotransferase class V-fold PLP-dependent enzyme [SAR202 cluster bacterium]|tara:strand:- start:5547 stop:6692 length:1146 start_codon:yes stop_codon:yes gene_type:complete
MTSQGVEFYERLGVKRLINAASWITVYGGSIMPPAVVTAMEDASRWFVDMHELNAKAGQVIANLTGAEAGLVTAGSAAGMVLEAAACMAGSDPAKVWRLPDTTGMKNEIILHRAHRVNYDHNFRAAGATLVEIGNSGSTAEWELEDAINENTAAVAYIFGPRRGGALPLDKVVEIAHKREVPVIVDAAAMLPPPENLTQFIAMGADMVSFSGGKGVLGPQSTGILAGRADLIEAAYANGAPNSDSIGRAAKVCKEEIAGLVTALEIFVDTDFEAVMSGWRDQCAHVVESLGDIPGLRLALSEARPEMLESMSNAPRALIYFEHDWKGPSRDQVLQMLEDGDPGVRVNASGFEGEIAIIPVNLRRGEEIELARRLREVLTGG